MEVFLDLLKEKEKVDYSQIFPIDINFTIQTEKNYITKFLSEYDKLPAKFKPTKHASSSQVKQTKNAASSQNATQPKNNSAQSKAELINL